MRRFASTEPAERLAQSWGQDCAHYGVCGDWLHMLPEGQLRHLRSGRPVAVGTDGLVYDITCPEIIRIHTEDGPSDGRCGIRVEAADADVMACPGHAESIRSWRAQDAHEEWVEERERG